jgi:hypothetical protein
MSDIEPPPATTDDRFLACQEALEDEFLTTFAKAVAVGWTVEEVTGALTELAENWMLADRGICDAEAVLAMSKPIT